MYMQLFEKSKSATEMLSSIVKCKKGTENLPTIYNIKNSRNATVKLKNLAEKS